MGKTKEEVAANVWDCGSPLYDSYELVSLTHLIERHLMSLPSLGVGGSSGRFTNNHSLPSDLAAGVGLTATAVVSLCCSSSSSSSSTAAASGFGGVFSKKWWKRTKSANNNVKQNVSDHLLCGLFNRSCSLKI